MPEVSLKHVYCTCVCLHGVTCLLSHLFPDPPVHMMDVLCSDVLQALAHDMANGEAKQLLRSAVSTMEQLMGLHANVLRHTSPASRSDNLCGLIELMAPGHHGWSSPFELIPVRSRSSSMSSSTSGATEMMSSLSLSSGNISGCGDVVQQARVIPDYIVYTIIPGNFLLNFECKKSHDNIMSATIQCTRQMLTQMHFQPYAFGILLSSSSWRLLFMEKDESNNTIDFTMYVESLKHDNKKDFSIDGFLSMLNWIYRILSWKAKAINTVNATI